MNKIKECNERELALRLIKRHNIGGGFRDEADLHNAKHHALESVSFALFLLKDIEGTPEEKIAFLSEMEKEIPQFTTKKEA